MTLFAAVGIAALALCGVASADSSASALACAPTTLASTPASPSAGEPCWVAVSPYPFGYNGSPVDPNNPYCANYPTSGSGSNPCYLVVDSLAFRSWNYGLAAVSPANSAYPSPYDIWRYNGTRWYPDPTFPGPRECPGSTVLWAGKLDAWLIGAGGQPGQFIASQASWPALCRFDGVTDQWEPLPVPAATIAATQATGAITAGACFAWNDCWFFGTSGAIVHWDGTVLTNATSGLAPSPWLQSAFTDAFTGTDASGNPFALASAALDTNAADVQPDGSPPPQLFRSTSEQVTSTNYEPPVATGAGSPGTDLDAIAFDSAGDGWIAGNPAAPVGAIRPTSVASPFSGGSYSGPSPLLPVTSSGAAAACAQPPSFTYSAAGTGGPSYLWLSLAVLPGGTVLAGGLVGQKQRRGTTSEPVIVQASCTGSPVITRFRIPDPSGGAALVPADAGGFVTALAASADNDAWAATDEGFTEIGSGQIGYFEPPELYQWTDGQTPDAPAGNAIEPRPIPVVPQPTIFEFPPTVVTTTSVTTTTTVTHGKTTVKRVRLKAAVYDIAKPTVAKAAGGKYTLSIAFRVRRRVRLGLDAVRAGHVVSSSGIKTFSGQHGTLTVLLSRQAWPTGLRFIVPGSRAK